jgi:hypothetical protein
MAEVATASLVCARCEAPCRRRVRWPEGVVCEACRKRASRRRGKCATCAVERLLPGNDVNGMPICVDCAGITTSFRCASCGLEDEFWYAQTCLRCSLRRRLEDLLDDGTGRVAPLLLPVFSALCAADPSRGRAGCARRRCETASGGSPRAKWPSPTRDSTRWDALGASSTSEICSRPTAFSHRGTSTSASSSAGQRTASTPWLMLRTVPPSRPAPGQTDPARRLTVRRRVYRAGRPGDGVHRPPLRPAHLSCGPGQGRSPQGARAGGVAAAR